MAQNLDRREWPAFCCGPAEGQHKGYADQGKPDLPGQGKRYFHGIDPFSSHIARGIIYSLSLFSALAVLMRVNQHREEYASLDEAQERLDASSQHGI